MNTPVENFLHTPEEALPSSPLQGTTPAAWQSQFRDVRLSGK